MVKQTAPARASTRVKSPIVRQRLQQPLIWRLHAAVAWWAMWPAAG